MLVRTHGSSLLYFALTAIRLTDEAIHLSLVNDIEAILKDKAVTKQWIELR
jgi:hypothetical protein